MSRPECGIALRPVNHLVFPINVLDKVDAITAEISDVKAIRALNSLMSMARILSLGIWRTSPLVSVWKLDHGRSREFPVVDGKRAAEVLQSANRYLDSDTHVTNDYTVTGDHDMTRRAVRLGVFRDRNAITEVELEYTPTLGF